MKVPRYAIWISFIVITLIVIGVITYNNYFRTTPTTSNSNSNTKISDSKKFKNDYEEMNNKEIDGHKLIELSIDENNPVYYASLNDIKKIKNGVVLLGSPSNPNTRNIIPVLLSVADSRGLSTIYYLETTDNNKSTLNEIYDIKTKDTEVLIIKDKKVIYQSKGLGVDVKDKYKLLSDDEKGQLATKLGIKMDEINPGVCDETC